MAFQFPDPQTTPEFTADNGITYSWDAVDGKWVVARGSGKLKDIRRDLQQLHDTGHCQCLQTFCRSDC